jgi:hypothetical protein
MNVQGMMNDVKIAATVAMGALGTGMSMFLAIIPNDIGKLASLVAIVLTGVLVRNHWRNGKKIDLENEKLKLEVEALKAQEADRDQAAKQRRRNGQPTRRLQDH